MTDSQRDKGRVITLTVMICIMLLGMCSCTVYKQPQMKITSVLAVTAEGDTLKLPIDVIRPIYNYNTYPTNRYPVTPNYFYYSPHRYQPIYGNSNYTHGSNSNNSNNNNNTPSVSTVKPSGSITPPPTPVDPRKN